MCVVSLFISGCLLLSFPTTHHPVITAFVCSVGSKWGAGPPLLLALSQSKHVDKPYSFDVIPHIKSSVFIFCPSLYICHTIIIVFVCVLDSSRYTQAYCWQTSPAPSTHSLSLFYSTIHLCCTEYWYRCVGILPKMQPCANWSNDTTLSDG